MGRQREVNESLAILIRSSTNYSLSNQLCYVLSYKLLLLGSPHGMSRCGNVTSPGFRGLFFSLLSDFLLAGTSDQNDDR